MTELTKVTWDLSDLYASVDDPKIDETLQRCLEQAKSFAEKYRGRIESPDLDTETLLSAIKDYESLAVEMSKPMNYASLIFSADTSRPEHGALLQKVQEKQTAIAIELIFFELELMKAAPETIDRLASDEKLANYKHFIEASRKFRDYKLTEPEEKIMEEKSLTGVSAFERLFEEAVSRIEFYIELDGEEKVMTEPEVLALLRHEDRETRQKAAASLSEGLERNSHLLTYIFNNIVFDKSVNDRLRGYEYAEQSRNLANELEMSTVQKVIDTCVENYDLVARYYNIKRDILGLDKLTHFDRYAPIFESSEEYDFDKAKDTVLKSFDAFSPTVKDAAEEFFTNNWIDAEPRKGKRGGAFCMYVTPDLHPYVFVNYLNKKDDIMTLAHELGHGVHAYLSRKQSYVNHSSVLPVAELASTFGEILVFESLVADAPLEEKLSLYAGKIEDIFATIFRQASMFRFEQAMHKARREHGELTTDDFCDMWQENIQTMFGNSVEMGDEHRTWWMYVGHFIFAPFYVYSYSFGELLVMALYKMYKEQGGAFTPKYIEMLSTGGAVSPTDLLSKLDIDINSADFWQGGMKVVEQFVDEFESLYNQWKNRE